MIYDLYTRRFIMPKSISISQLNQLMSTKPQPIIIDIREPYQFAGYHLNTAVNIPYQTLVMYPERYLNRTTTYYLICEHGGESYRACMMLESSGYHVISIAGGYSNMRYRY